MNDLTPPDPDAAPDAVPEAGRATAPDARPHPRRVVTLDGPAASGKSSVALRVAAALGIPFVSSGILYRAVTRLVLDAGIEPGDRDAVMALLTAHRVELRPGADGNRMVLDGSDATERLHTDEIDAAVSAVAAHPPLRGWVLARLRELAGPFVVEGRDMGTAVFPDAVAKFYLTASPEVRAERRLGEREAGFGELVDAIRRRDAGDARQLRPASDALRIATDELTLEQVVAAVLDRLDAGAFAS